MENSSYEPKRVPTSKTLENKKWSRNRARQVAGQPAGPCLAFTKARVVKHNDDLLKFIPREILVCDTIDPHMTFVARLASGRIDRRGGML
ncbi:MAG: hypothetical protein ACP5U1_05580 [Desulfomonilaceae bacterium]